jgi:RNA polymerase sigma-70 factor (ECF subfamily)
MSASGRNPSGWLTAARAGSLDALGQALAACHGYLLTIASQELDNDLKAKGGASDLVQETFLKAHRHFGDFGGNSQDELRAWLRRLLLNNLADFRRRYQQSGKRQTTREVALEQSQSSSMLAHEPAAEGPSPSYLASAREQAMLLEDTLKKLPSDYQEVLVLRYREGLSFESIAAKMNRTVNAVQKLWTRAILRIRDEWENQE